MHTISKREGQDFLRVINAIQDEKIRYFYMMLGEVIGTNALALQTPINDSRHANTGPTHIEELQQRLNATG